MPSVADRKDGYYTINGERYVSVTNVLDNWIPAPELVRWKIREAVKAHDEEAPNRIAGDAANRGTDIHDYIKAVNQGKPKPEVPEEQLGFAAAFELFRAEHAPLLLASEHTVVSDRDGYAGTLDAAAGFSFGRAVVDFKTIKAKHLDKKPWPKQWAQVEAYRRATDEMGLGLKLTHLVVVRLADDGNYRLHWRGPEWQDRAWMVFYHALGLMRAVGDLR